MDDSHPVAPPNHQSTEKNQDMDVSVGVKQTVSRSDSSVTGGNHSGGGSSSGGSFPYFRHVATRHVQVIGEGEDDDDDDDDDGNANDTEEQQQNATTSRGRRGTENNNNNYNLNENDDDDDDDDDNDDDDDWSTSTDDYRRLRQHLTDIDEGIKTDREDGSSSTLREQSNSSSSPFRLDRLLSRLNTRVTNNTTTVNTAIDRTNQEIGSRSNKNSDNTNRSGSSLPSPFGAPTWTDLVLSHRLGSNHKSNEEEGDDDDDVDPFMSSPPTLSILRQAALLSESSEETSLYLTNQIPILDEESYVTTEDEQSHTTVANNTTTTNRSKNGKDNEQNNDGNSTTPTNNEHSNESGGEEEDDDDDDDDDDENSVVTELESFLRQAEHPHEQHKSNSIFPTVNTNNKDGDASLGGNNNTSSSTLTAAAAAASPSSSFKSPKYYSSRSIPFVSRVLSYLIARECHAFESEMEETLSSDVLLLNRNNSNSSSSKITTEQELKMLSNSLKSKLQASEQKLNDLTTASIDMAVFTSAMTQAAGSRLSTQLHKRKRRYWLTFFVVCIWCWCVFMRTIGNYHDAMEELFAAVHTLEMSKEESTVYHISEEVRRRAERMGEQQSWMEFGSEIMEDDVPFLSCESMPSKEMAAVMSDVITKQSQIHGGRDGQQRRRQHHQQNEYGGGGRTCGAASSCGKCGGGGGVASTEPATALPPVLRWISILFGGSGDAVKTPSQQQQQHASCPSSPSSSLSSEQKKQEDMAIALQSSIASSTFLFTATEKNMLTRGISRSQSFLRRLAGFVGYQDACSQSSSILFEYHADRLVSPPPFTLPPPPQSRHKSHPLGCDRLDYETNNTVTTPPPHPAAVGSKREHHYPHSALAMHTVTNRNDDWIWSDYRMTRDNNNLIPHEQTPCHENPPSSNKENDTPPAKKPIKTSSSSSTTTTSKHSSDHFQKEHLDSLGASTVNNLIKNIILDAARTHKKKRSTNSSGSSTTTHKPEEPFRILDVGCGVGGTMFALSHDLNLYNPDEKEDANTKQQPSSSSQQQSSSFLPPFEYHGITLTAAETIQARKEALRQNINAQKVSFDQANFDNVSLFTKPKKTSSTSNTYAKTHYNLYQVIIAVESLSFSQNISHTLFNLYNALKPGGILIIIDDVSAIPVELIMKKKKKKHIDNTNNPKKSSSSSTESDGGNSTATLPYPTRQQYSPVHALSHTTSRPSMLLTHHGWMEVLSISGFSVSETIDLGLHYDLPFVLLEDDVLEGTWSIVSSKIRNVMGGLDRLIPRFSSSSSLLDKNKKGRVRTNGRRTRRRGKKLGERKKRRTERNSIRYLELMDISVRLMGWMERKWNAFFGSSILNHYDNDDVAGNLGNTISNQQNMHDPNGTSNSSNNNKDNLPMLTTLQKNEMLHSLLNDMIKLKWADMYRRDAYKTGQLNLLMFVCKKTS